ncbi:endonuclease [Paracoccus sp. M683]|uniref:Z1 domain-containing protein n=1 Tax=Paracoccus sp. M683 TaxID=2594268 RepID=UPI00117DA0DC|nr:Z1 domain-containing protein [Paracoccus sp. M683]TRW96328.1 endonuclease [Paracoccus sp. M683]
MNLNKVESQKNFTSALISALSLLPETPTREEVGERAKQLAAVFAYDGPLETVIDDALIAVDSRMGAGVSLVDVEADHDDEWVYKREDITWTYSDAYEEYLKKEQMHPTVVRSLSDVGTKIVGHLQDPTSEGKWDRRGLVIGHVQSGKTANYMGVIAKAADAGYKFIIVIAGIHNNLRKQTQERIDEGFVGRSSDPENRKRVGVGLNRDYPHPATLTNINDDFSKKTANQSGWKINDLNKPTVLVIKKNVSTLKALRLWLKEMNAQADGVIGDVPMLMIDDEADNASINTNKPELDPTKTNTMLRKILGLFAKSCYVGYTATPFANIFINPDSYDEEAYEELFPRDFIVSLDAPNTYFGPDKVFLDETSSARIVRPIRDCEDYLPFSHKRDDPVPELPPSLYEAIDQFIVARAIRNLRGQVNKHCSMMINVSRFVVTQNTVRNFVSLYEKKVREAVKVNYAMPDSVSQKNEVMVSLKACLDKEFSDCGFTWSDIKVALNDVFDNLRIFVVNSKSDEALDYKKYERDGNSLTAIAIGGLSLSRGLTIEGLTVSYMYRNTRMYDTLMQMGRWFGYRPGFEDVCRVHLSPDSINWYGHIAEASEELRQQIKRMRRDRLSPKQFGLYVKAHPDRLLITAANKMRAGEKITVNQNFSGKIVESSLLPTDDKVNEENEALITEYWKKKFGCAALEETGKGWLARDAKISEIEEFLTKFRSHPDFADRKSAALNYLRALSEKYAAGDVLLISVSANGEDADKYILGTQERNSASPDGNAWRVSKDRVASRGDEKLGLSDPQKEEAAALACEDGEDKKPSDFHFRSARKKPLLMLHVLGPVGKDANARVPAFGLSFPPGHYQTEVEVVANQVWIERMQGGSFDTPDEEEDYDE